jgi:hypothetical protein
MEIKIIGDHDTEGQLGDWELMFSYRDYSILTYETGYTAEEAVGLAEARLPRHLQEEELFGISAELKATIPQY